MTREYRGHTLKNRTGRANDWFVSFGSRVRWGSLSECEADVDYIETHGHMPPRLTGGWS